MYVPEALAATVYLNLHLTDTMGDPTATQVGLMPLFKQTTAFYKMPAHAALYHNTRDLPGRVTASVANIGTNLTQLSDGRTVAHLINHNYSRGFQEQDAVRVSFPVARAPRSVTLVSPDFGADRPVTFTYSEGHVQVKVPKLVAYVAVVSN
jgi:6-phosphogluconolactonase (cycloisomerase 2 family)